MHEQCLVPATTLVIYLHRWFDYYKHIKYTNAAQWCRISVTVQIICCDKLIAVIIKSGNSYKNSFSYWGNLGYFVIEEIEHKTYFYNTVE